YYCYYHADGLFFLKRFFLEGMRRFSLRRSLHFLSREFLALTLLRRSLGAPQYPISSHL
ncbi:hypothetical protein CSUI_008338, partial [Cystoisospora suis]